MIPVLVEGLLLVADCHQINLKEALGRNSEHSHDTAQQIAGHWHATQAVIKSMIPLHKEFGFNCVKDLLQCHTFQSQ